MPRPMSVDQIAQILIDQGDGRSLDAIRVQIVRSIESGALEGAYKVNPDRATSPWLVPPESVKAWLEDAEV